MNNHLDLGFDSSISSIHFCQICYELTGVTVDFFLILISFHTCAPHGTISFAERPLTFSSRQKIFLFRSLEFSDDKNRIPFILLTGLYLFHGKIVHSFHFLTTLLTAFIFAVEYHRIFHQLRSMTLILLIPSKYHIYIFTLHLHHYLSYPFKSLACKHILLDK